jgi:phenylacetate-CoA ligase
MTDLHPIDPDVEFLDRESLDRMQLEKLLNMLKHVAATNDFYAERWRDAGVEVSKVRTFADFRSAIPVIEKADILDDQRAHPPFGKRLGKLAARGERMEVYTTSGTSGQGVELHAQSKRELAMMERIYAHYFSWAGLKPGDSTMLTLPITMLAGGRAEYQGAVAYDLTTYPIGNYAAAQKVDNIRRFRPKALFGSSSYFAHLATHMGEEAGNVGVEVLLTGLEGVGLSFFERLQATWNARAADRFGCALMRTDFMFTDERGVGTRNAPNRLLNMDPYVYLEVLDPHTGLPVKDGEFGEMVVTSLYHFDNPVIRGRLKDGGVFRSGAVGEGPRRFHGVELASIGRIDDVKKIKGINVYPQALDDLLYGLPEVEQYEVVLSSTSDYRDVATIRLQLRSAWGDGTGARVTSEVRDLCKIRLGIHFDVELAEHIAVSDYKARRWKDLRQRE